jgi:hypothetical protein
MTDDDYEAIWETEVTGENLARVTLHTTNTTRLDPGRCDGKPESNRLSNNTANP